MADQREAAAPAPGDEHKQYVTRLFARFRDPLLRHLTDLLKGREDAEDVLQDTYLRLLGAASLERSDARARAFMFEVARNLAYDKFRRRRVHAVQPDADLDTLPSAEPPLERTVAFEQGLAMVKRTLLELAPRCRQVFLLRAVEGLSYEDIAARLAVSKRTVEREMQQALDACQDRLRTGPNR